jgi:AAA+ ATPase superfamily predicted ATPase
MSLNILHTLRGYHAVIPAPSCTASSSICVLYGRRRIGKTTLLTHWLETRGHPGFYWLATDTSSAALLRSLSAFVYRAAHGEPPVDPEQTYPNWEKLLREIIRLAGGRREKLVVILDEFTYAIDAYHDLPHKLQAAWDQALKDLPILLILSGSHIGMMENEILARRAPLYGRATGSIKLRPLPFKDVRAMFPRYDTEACIALYSVLGGVPYYLQRMDPEASVSEHIGELGASEAGVPSDRSRCSPQPKEPLRNHGPVSPFLSPLSGPAAAVYRSRGVFFGLENDRASLARFRGHTHLRRAVPGMGLRGGGSRLADLSISANRLT